MARQARDPNTPPNPKMGLNLKKLSPRARNAIVTLAKGRKIEPADFGLMLLEAAAHDAGPIIAAYHRREAEYFQASVPEGEAVEG